ncbi:hypothetical protein LEP1GSC024_0845 [Leptospira noguchii str. 2001034031]|uniref:Uncharacterized protein n=1 Tax=Leptospira noguchii str. 2001034031 TaxID=1193053 RepID=M6Y688_9LEPT|nr:hypothetical protein LEP1GSC024_0845 [Leptospira noguchii str. 2001034031]
MRCFRLLKKMETHAKIEKPDVYNAMQNVGLPRFIWDSKIYLEIALSPTLLFLKVKTFGFLISFLFSAPVLGYFCFLNISSPLYRVR